MASDLKFGGGPLSRQRPALGCSANEEEDYQGLTSGCLVVDELSMDHM